MTDEDQFLIEAAHEVDALYPDTAPIAPEIAARIFGVPPRLSSTVEGLVDRGYSVGAATEYVGLYGSLLALDGCPRELHDDGRCLKKSPAPRPEH